MALFKKMGMFPDVKQITAEVNAKFDQLLAKLEEILQAIKEGTK